MIKAVVLMIPRNWVQPGRNLESEDTGLPWNMYEELDLNILALLTSSEGKAAKMSDTGQLSRMKSEGHRRCFLPFVPSRNRARLGSKLHRIKLVFLWVGAILE